MVYLPGSSAVTIENVEIFARKQFTAIDTGLNGAKTAQNSYLLHIADERYNVETLQFGVDGVQAADQVLQEQLEGLRKA